MKLNLNGTISASSVENLEKVRLVCRETETYKNALIRARIRGKVQLNQVAVHKDKQWLRVDAKSHYGAHWIEIQ